MLSSKSLADEFPLRFPSLLIETIILGILIGYGVITFVTDDPMIFIIEGIILVVIAILFELIFGLRTTTEETLASSGVHLSASGIEIPKDVSLIDKKLSRNITKAFLLSAVVLILLAESGTSENKVVTQISQITLLVVILSIPFSVFFGIVQIFRNPKVSTSRVFDAYISGSTIFLGIPLAVLLFFLIGSMVVLFFISPEENPTEILITTILVSIIIMFILQIGYIVNVLRNTAEYHGMSVSQYLVFKMSHQEKERIKEAKKARAQHVDKLYEKLPTIKQKVRPWDRKAPTPYQPIDMNQYEYDVTKSPLRTLLTEFGPAILGIIVADIVLALFFIVLSGLS